MNKITKSFMTLAAAGVTIAPVAAVVSCNDTESKKVDELKKEIEKVKADKTASETNLQNQINTLQADKKVVESKLKDAIDRYNTVSLASSNAWNSISAEKEAMGREVYAHATRLFDKMITQPNVTLKNINKEGDKVVVTATEEGKFIPVVFMDLDETVLNNFAFQNYLVTHNTFFSPALWGDFVSQAISKEVAGAIDFIKHVWDKGGVVMFNSNRDQGPQTQQSLDNLVKLGLDAKLMPDWIWWMQGTDKVDAKTFDQAHRNVRVSKEERMHWINTHKLTIDNVQAQFKVVMRVGDDISDFNDNFSKKAKITNKEVVAALKNKEINYGKLFGNDSLDVKSVYYDKDKNEWVNEDFAASYILIPGNTSYGSWVKQAVGSSKFNFDKINESLEKEGWVFTPKSSTTNSNK
ncbi:HAD family acid phosphatase [Mycoplasma sp. VS509_3]|uniref:HAD family acid phosphatase n=1 Tax=unclassified Mycoplasma TaxID=2683645 RepID=UPI003AB0388C